MFSMFPKSQPDSQRLVVCRKRRKHTLTLMHTHKTLCSEVCECKIKNKKKLIAFIKKYIVKTSQIKQSCSYTQDSFVASLIVTVCLYDLVGVTLSWRQWAVSDSSICFGICLKQSVCVCLCGVWGGGRVIFCFRFLLYCICEWKGQVVGQKQRQNDKDKKAKEKKINL